MNYNDAVPMAVTMAAEASPTVIASNSRTKLVHLQALRGVAASMVVLHHSVLALAIYGLMSATAADRLVYCAGEFGVATFFVISGFIIYRTSRTSFGTMSGAAEFVIKRLIRILPVYWIATAVFVALSPHRSEYSVGDVLYSILLIPHALTDAVDLHPLVGQGWTLQYEMLFYAIVTVGLLFKRTTGTLVIVASLLALVAFGTYLMAPSDMTEPATLLQYWTRPIMLLFAVGIGFGVLAEHQVRPFPVPAALPIILALPAVWLACSLFSPYSAQQQIQFPAVLLLWALCALCVFISVFCRSAVSRMEWVAEAFGDASYSVYLFHAFILSALLRLKVQDISPVLFVVVALVGSNVLGLLMYGWVEKPILKLLRRTLLKPA